MVTQIINIFRKKCLVQPNRANNLRLKKTVSKKPIFLICSIILIAIYIFLFNKCKYCNIKRTKNQPASVFIEIGMFFKQIKYSGKSVVKQEGILLIIGYDCG